MGGYEFTSVFSFSVMRTLQKNWTNKFIFEWIINKEVSKNSLTLHIKNDTSFSSGLKQLRFYKVVIKFRAELYRGSSISVLICIRWKFWDLESRQIDLLDLAQLVGLQLFGQYFCPNPLTRNWISLWRSTQWSGSQWRSTAVQLILKWAMWYSCLNFGT